MKGTFPARNDLVGLILWRLQGCYTSLEAVAHCARAKWYEARVRVPGQGVATPSEARRKVSLVVTTVVCDCTVQQATSYIHSLRAVVEGCPIQLDQYKLCDTSIPFFCCAPHA